MHTSDEKAHLRRAVEERIARISAQEHSAESRTLCRELLPHIPKGSCVCAYHPMKTEVDILPLLDQLQSRGERVFLPCFEGGTLLFREWEAGQVLQKGALGVLEPPKNAKEPPPEEMNIVLVPGRAFDAEGNRMGRGNGGYDRWIRLQREHNPHTLFFGVALECQMVEKVPVEAHDEKMDAVVTARGVEFVVL
ncbi:5-formyltetrahydrofolate cyclo-ligase [Candidatus Peregrinibacteria bacterium CG10_big_fil_rev_8_21_14_0_10_49_10]|nr:MAG: 5-formyltetrahydrofolate cyclo-ligase [Candidatus Peregrinibacteria bacterium CG10_big_fil_rev_8_21_14_0_10_49_10]